MGKSILKNDGGFIVEDAAAGSGIEFHPTTDVTFSRKATLLRPLGSVVRSTADAALTIDPSTSVLVLAADVTASRVVTLPPAIEGSQLRVIWEVEQASDDRVFTRAGSDVMFGSITVKKEGNAAGDGNVEVGAITSVTLTCKDDTNIGSYLDFQCIRDGVWFVSGIQVGSAEDGLVAFA